jgi:hypothetical protein
MIDVSTALILGASIVLATTLNKIADIAWEKRKVNKHNAERYAYQDFKKEVFRRLQGLESASVNYNNAIYELQKGKEKEHGR